jgi:hypothetical protein
MKKMCIALLFSLTSLLAFSQIEALHVNAGWNEANDVEWFSKLKDCDISELLIENDNNQAKYKIASVPTIIILDDGEEVKRFQADLSFKMVATRKEVEEYIEELIISKF